MALVNDIRNWNAKEIDLKYRLKVTSRDVDFKIQLYQVTPKLHVVAFTVRE